MSGRKKNARRRRRGKWRRKKKSYRNRTHALTSRVSPLPDIYSTTLKYTHYGSNTAIAWNQHFRLNSLFDPDLSGVGHQPMGFDELSSLYGRYRVDAVRVDVTCSNRSSETVIVAMVPKNDSANLTDLTEGTELTRSKRMVITPSGNGQASKRMTFWVSNRAIAGATKQEYKSDDRYQALISTNPSESINLSILGGGVSASSVTIDYVFKFSFKCTFFDRVTLGTS